MKLNYLLLASLLILFVACSEDEPTPNTPISVVDFTLTIDENPDPGQVLGTVMVNDASGTLTFSLDAQTPGGALSINSATGELTVANASLFDFETNPQITATVNVTNGSSNDSGSITITLNDLVETTPEFTIWDGPDFTFSKSNNADPMLEANQDRITETVWITRDNDGGQIYNINVEAQANKATSPAGTKWAIGEVSDIANLSFELFRDTIEPKDVVGKKLILYLEDEDAYVPLTFSSWTRGSANGGGFTYTRASKPN